MAATILSQDVLAICIFFADGDIELFMEEIILRLEDYQEKENRRFGIERSDFRCLFSMLIDQELDIKSFGDGLEEIKLRELITDILSYHDTYFNDEGEYWMKGDSAGGFWSDFDDNEYHEKMIIKQKMKSFFGLSKRVLISQKSVKNFMTALNINETILRRCSKPG